jgi:hypothetical protein
MENIRTSASVQSVIEVMEGSIENLSLRNIEVCYRDKCTDLSENQYAFRGEHLLRLFGAKDVTLENFHISGTMYGVEEPVRIENCEGLTKRNCNF